MDMLTRGASPYDVAKMLGDTIETVEKHYTPFVKSCVSESVTSSKPVLDLKNLLRRPQNDPKSPQRSQIRRNSPRTSRIPAQASNVLKLASRKSLKNKSEGLNVSVTPASQSKRPKP